MMEIADGGSATLRIAAPAHTGAWALEIQDAEEVRRVPLSSSPLVLGSSRAAHVVVHDRTVSSRHCEIVVAGRGVAVRDLGSTNGTYVGGARVEQAWGMQGTAVTIGQSTLVCTALDEGDQDDRATPLVGVAGNSIAMRRLAAKVRRLACLSAPVLICGETGVGKELVARALHAEGPRALLPFVAINVAALPRELVESELFGHERGAFTGAVTRRLGAFAEAEEGSLFLDEIGELPLDAQPKLLRALDGYEVRRIGASGVGRRATARIVAATHVKLADRVHGGSFRRDLFHRLEVFVIDLPPLRERPGDIPAIARAVLREMQTETGDRELTPAALAKLTAYAWPGNVRELRNVLCRSVDLSGPQRWLDASAVERALHKPRQARVTLTEDIVQETLKRHHGNVSAAARALGVPRTTFRKLLPRP